MISRTPKRLVATSILSVLVLGCDPFVNAESDASQSADAGPVPATDAVDLLIVVDNRGGGYASEEQQDAALFVPRLLSSLMSGDIDHDGVPDLTPVGSMHVGVVSGDMGVGAARDLAGCPSAFGDDGVLRATRTGAAVCEYPMPRSIFAFDPSASIPSVGQEVSCVVSMRTSGCGIAQLLEAPLKALSPAPSADGSSPVAWTRDGYVAPTFFGGTSGHAGPGGANDGFVRDGSVLAIWVVTPLDDCSGDIAQLFASGEFPDLICHQTPDPRFPIERYSAGFLGLRRHPSRLVFAASTGIPIGSDGDSNAEILADPLMQEARVSTPEPGIQPVCGAIRFGSAEPARRIVTLALQLEAAGARTALHSTCEQTDGSLFATRFVQAIASAMTGG